MSKKFILIILLCSSFRMEAADPDGIAEKNTSTISWSKHNGSRMKSANYTLKVCKDHFPSGSDARNEIESAVSYFNSLGWNRVQISIKETSHKSKEELFSETPSASYFDYVDNDESGTHPCHRDNTTACSDDADEGVNGFAMNTCTHQSDKGWNGGGSNGDYTVISVNSHCYSHYSNSSSTNYPKAKNIAHELGHTLGMIHTPNWPSSDQGFLSIMQGNIGFLTAYDIAHIKNNYFRTSSDESKSTGKPLRISTPMDLNHYGIGTGNSVGSKDTDFRASDVVRYYVTGGSYDNNGFDPNNTDVKTTSSTPRNPTQLYLADDGNYKDCDTDEDPIFMGTFFNLGTVPVTEAKPFHFVFTMRSEKIDNYQVMKSFEVDTIEGLSQESWAGKITVPESVFGKAAWPFVRIDGTFKIEVDNEDDFSETDESNNQAHINLDLYKKKSNCK